MAAMTLDSKTLVEYIFFDRDSDGAMRVECNLCNEDDYLFFRGPLHLLTEEDWVAKAVTHILAHHEGVD